MSGQKSFSGAAVATALTAAAGSADTTLYVAATTNWPNTTVGPFVITIDAGSSVEEKVLIASYTGTTLTVASGGRGYDGTSAATHQNGATVAHTIDAGTVQQVNTFANANGTVTPSTSAVGDAAADGVSAAPAAADHKHAREAFSTTVAASAPGDVGTAGTSALPSRGDHKHPREAAPYAPSPGDIKMMGTASATSGWLLCDGTAYSRSAYSALFSAIGTAYGAGDGSTTFNVPFMCGRVPVGSGQGASLTNRALGALGGEETHALTTGELASHAHTHNAHTHTDAGHDHGAQGLEYVVGLSGGTGYYINTPGGSAGTNTVTFTPATSLGSAAINGATTTEQTAGSGTGHNTMPPFLVVNYAIHV